MVCLPPRQRWQFGGWQMHSENRRQGSRDAAHVDLSERYGVLHIGSNKEKGGSHLRLIWKISVHAEIPRRRDQRRCEGKSKLVSRFECDEEIRIRKATLL